MDSDSGISKDIIELTLPFDAIFQIEEPKPNPNGGDAAMRLCISMRPPRESGLPVVELGLDKRLGVRGNCFDIIGVFIAGAPGVVTGDGVLRFSFAVAFGLL